MAGRHGELTGAGEIPLVAPEPGEVARPQQRGVGLLRHRTSVDVLGLLGLALLILVCVLMGLFGADSRPGFSDGRTDVKDRWFVHSKTDYR